MVQVNVMLGVFSLVLGSLGFHYWEKEHVNDRRVSYEIVPDGIKEKSRPCPDKKAFLDDRIKGAIFVAALADALGTLS